MMYKLIRNSSHFRQLVKNIGKQNHLKTYEAGHVRWKSYKVAILEEFQKPMVLTNIKNDIPVGLGMIRIAVEYCSLNLTDVSKLSENEQYEVHLPIIPGNEYSGEVLDVGAYSTKNIKVGDKVAALLAHDHQISGGLAEEAVVSENDCFPIGSVTLKHAAALINGHSTALLAFTKYCELKENDIVIVIAGVGGNGLAAIQMAKNVFKCKVYVICDTEDTSKVIREEGAHKSISVNEGLTKVYKFLDTSLKDSKAKVVYDAVGCGLMYIAADFVDPVNGCFLSVDPFYDASKFPSTKPEFKKTKKPNETDEDTKDNFVEKIQHLSLHDLREKDKPLYRQIVEETLSLCEEEIVTPYISETFGLHEVNEAVEYIRNKKCTGKVLIDIKKPMDKDNDDKDDKKDGKDSKKSKEEDD